MNRGAHGGTPLQKDEPLAYLLHLDCRGRTVLAVLKLSFGVTGEPHAHFNSLRGISWFSFSLNEEGQGCTVKLWVEEFGFSTTDHLFFIVAVYNHIEDRAARDFVCFVLHHYLNRDRIVLITLSRIRWKLSLPGSGNVVFTLFFLTS